MFRTLRSLIWSCLYAVAVLVFIGSAYMKFFRVRYAVTLVSTMFQFYVSWLIVGVFALSLRTLWHKFKCEYRLYFADTVKAVTIDDKLFKLSKYLYWESGIVETVTLALTIPIRVPVLIMSIIMKSDYVDALLFPRLYGEYGNYDTIYRLTEKLQSEYSVLLRQDWIACLRKVGSEERKDKTKFCEWLQDNSVLL